MKVKTNITAERLKNGSYKIVNVIEQLLDKKEMLNLVKTRQGMKSKTENKIATLTERKKNIRKEMAETKAKTLAEIKKQLSATKESINMDAINNEVEVLKTAIDGDKEMFKLDENITKLIKEYQAKQEKLKKDADKINETMQKRMKKI